jgi:hypothetical protein
MKTKSFVLALFLIAWCGNLTASIIELQTGEMGYYWYERSTWLGGSDTSTGFAYGDAQGVQHVQRNYQYYGGSDRYWQQKDLYFQISLADITEPLAGSAVFRFYVTANNSPVESILKHLGTQTTSATGDAGQKLAGDTNVAGTGSFSPGWNSVDVTSFIASDLTNGYAYSAFSIPQFAQVQDQNRLLSLYGPGATVDVDGLPVRPYLEYTTIPEPNTALLVILGLMATQIRTFLPKVGSFRF